MQRDRTWPALLRRCPTIAPLTRNIVSGTPGRGSTPTEAPACAAAQLHSTECARSDPRRPPSSLGENTRCRTLTSAPMPARARTPPLSENTCPRSARPRPSHPSLHLAIPDQAPRGLDIFLAPNDPTTQPTRLSRIARRSLQVTRTLEPRHPRGDARIGGEAPTTGHFRANPVNLDLNEYIREWLN